MVGWLITNMAMAFTLTPTPTPSTITTSRSYLSHTNQLFRHHRYPTIKLPSSFNNNNHHRVFFKVSASSSSSFQALIFDCDGVILESEHLHRQAYNDAFLHFNVRSPSSSPQPLNWDIEFYDQLQNQIGGGKPKMRWYFKEHGWPSSTLFETPPTNDEERAKLIDTLQDWKTERYKDIIKSGSVKPRPGVLRLMDEARDAGKKLAVCSAATKSSVILCLENLIGNERFQSLDCFLAGDDVKEKKPDPSIYLTASKKLGVSEKNCLVVEDSVIGLQCWRSIPDSRMESENKQISKQKKNMDVLDILGQTLTIYFKNINFIIFTLLTSLPFFFLMVYFETLFQQTLVQTPKIISSLPFQEKPRIAIISMVSDDDYSVSYIDDVPSFSKDYLPLLIQLGFIYTIPLHVLEFCSKVLTMDLASKLMNSEENNTDNMMSLKHMFQNSIDLSIMKGTFKTSLYTLALSNCLLIAFPWVVSNCFGLASTFWCYIIFGTICFVAIAKLLMVYLEWSAIWNMSIVISVLDGIYGIGAMRVSYYFSSGNQKRGLVLMLVFFVFGGFLRLMCIYFECYKGGSGIFLQIGVLTVLNSLKWVACVVYFNDCKERKTEKKVDDEEMGKDKLESSNS